MNLILTLEQFYNQTPLSPTNILYVNLFAISVKSITVTCPFYFVPDPEACRRTVIVPHLFFSFLVITDARGSPRDPCIDYCRSSVVRRECSRSRTHRVTGPTRPGVRACVLLQVQLAILWNDNGLVKFAGKNSRSAFLNTMKVFL